MKATPLLFTPRTILPLLATLCMLLSCAGNEPLRPDSKEEPNTSHNDPNGTGGNENNNSSNNDLDFSNLHTAKGLLKSSQALPPENHGDAQYGTSKREVTEYTYNGKKGILISEIQTLTPGGCYDAFVVGDPKSEILYPGNVLTSHSIVSGDYTEVKGKRVGEITWSTSDLTPRDGSDFLIEKITDPKLSDYNKALQRFKRDSKPQTSARTTFSMSQVTNENELKFRLGVGVGIQQFGGEISGSFKKETKRTTILARFEQELFSVALDQPRKPILEAVDMNSLNGELPVYISSISYGRLAYCLISSNADITTLGAALSASIPIKFVNLKGELSGEYKKVLEEASFKLFFLGGDANCQTLAASGSWDGFIKALQSPFTVDNARPIAFNLRYIDDNSEARLVKGTSVHTKKSEFVEDIGEFSFDAKVNTMEASYRDEGEKHKARFIGTFSVVTSDNMVYSLGVWDNRSLILPLQMNKQIPVTNAQPVPIHVKRAKDMPLIDFLENTSVKLMGKIGITYYTSLFYGYSQNENFLGAPTVQLSLMDILKGKFITPNGPVLEAKGTSKDPSVLGMVKIRTTIQLTPYLNLIQIR